MALARILDGVVQQGCDGLVFTAAVFPHQGADADQVREVRNRFAFAALRSMDFFGPLQGFAVARGGHEWLPALHTLSLMHCRAIESERHPSAQGWKRGRLSLS